MPRNSLKKQFIARLEEIISSAVKHSLRLQILGLPTDKVDELVLRCVRLRQKAVNNRYLFRPTSYRRRQGKFAQRLNEVEGDGNLTDNEFRFHFRMSRECYWELVGLLENHPSFNRKGSDSRGPPPKPGKYQLLVLLKYYGCDGNQASSKALSDFFGVASGVIDSYRMNALEAVLSLEDVTYIWPDALERKVISNRIQADYKFPNCVGLIDGTLLPLATRPLLHGENYLSRKKFYAIVMLVVCDDLSRILYHHIGWPGSVHDNRVWRNCRLNRKKEEFFSGKQYLLGDSAFTASQVMIPPFKSPAGGEVSDNRKAFNTLLSKPRVKSEHCIGVLKGRFPFLRGIRLKLACKADMKVIIDHVRGSVVLHNFLRTEEPEEEDWLDLADIHAGEEDNLAPEPAEKLTNEADYSRRDELYFYLSELEETTIN